MGFLAIKLYSLAPRHPGDPSLQADQIPKEQCSPTTSVESSTKTDNLQKSEGAAQTRAGHRRPARCSPETLCLVPGEPPLARCLAQGRRLLRAEQGQDGLQSTQSDKQMLQAHV